LPARRAGAACGGDLGAGAGLEGEPCVRRDLHEQRGEVDAPAATLVAAADVQGGQHLDGVVEGVQRGLDRLAQAMGIARRPALDHLRTQGLGCTASLLREQPADFVAGEPFRRHASGILPRSFAGCYALVAHGGRFWWQIA
jgi:hypothetical protein